MNAPYDSGEGRSSAVSARAADPAALLDNEYAAIFVRNCGLVVIVPVSPHD